MKNIFLKDPLYKKAIAALIEVVPHKKETIMTAAQQLETRGEKRGMRQGIQQGIQQEKLHIAKNMLYKLHLDTTAVSKVTGLSQAELSKLRE